MAQLAYIKAKATKGGALPGTTAQKRGVEGVAEIKPDTHSDVVSIEYRVHATIDSKDGRPTSSHTSEPLRVTLELDQNYASYMAAMIANDSLQVEILMIRSQGEGKGGYEKSMLLKLSNATIADVRLLTGTPSAESATTGKTRNQYDSPELYEVSFSYTRLDGDSFVKGSNGSISWTDDWAAPGTSAPK